MITVIIIAATITLSYVLLMIYLTFGFFKTKYAVGSDISNVSYKTKVSIIVALRNEGNSVEVLMASLLSQTYPLIEIILVDDSSTDATYEKLGKYTNVTLYSSVGGKKMAIALGVNNASGDLIVTTDADCRASRDWIASIVNFYNLNGNPKMILAPVRFEGKGIFADIQALEFATLIAATCGSSAMNNAIMCNAANMAFEKNTYHEVDLCNQYSSGDDMFLLQSIKSEYGANTVMFLKSQEAIVNTDSTHSLKEFINQRVRWTSKAGGYKDISIIASALVLFAFCLMILVLLITGGFNIQLFELGLTILLVKIIIDMPIVVGICSFLKQRKLLKYYFLEQLLYILYIPTIAIFTAIKKRQSPISDRGSNQKW